MLSYVQHSNRHHSVMDGSGSGSGSGNGQQPIQNALDDVRWINIQLNTFKNWLNEHLSNNFIADISKDFADGTKLINLVEVLQNRRCTGKVYRNNPSQIQMLANVQLALDAMRDDGVKLVNIGCYDIVEGNLKLILGLIWCLILRYQISGNTKIPPRKLLLAWLQAILPELKIKNFNTNWNNGIALNALLNYCDQELFSDWRSLDVNDSINNCSRAIRIAKERFAIPTVLLPEDLANPNLDELSCMTYLSYFSKVGGPGYMATLRRVRSLAHDTEVGNFTTDWNDGFILCTIVVHLGGSIQNYPHISTDRMYWIKNLTEAVSSARKLGVEPFLTPEEMADKEVHHLAVMTYAARLFNVKPVHSDIIGDHARIQMLPFATYHTDQQVSIEVVFLDRSLKLTELEPRVMSPSGGEISYQQMRTPKGAALSFVPNHPGMYQVHVYCYGEEIKGSPVSLKVTSSTSPLPLQPQLQLPLPLQATSLQVGRIAVGYNNNMPQPAPPASSGNEPESRDLGKVSFSGLSEPCAVGSIVEVVTNAHGATSQGTVLVEANAPTGKVHKCQVHQRGNTYTATFTPFEIGDWTIAILYDGEHIRGSPFLCQVYDANLVQVYGLDVGVVGQELKFNVNTSQAGRGELKVQTWHHGRQIPCAIEKHGSGANKVKFTPDGAGQYKIHVYFNNMEVKGSPFVLDIVDASSVSVYGENLRMACVDRLATFMIHAVGADSKDLTVTIAAPSGKKKRARITPVGDSIYQVEWKPVEAGEHYIDVRLYTQSVADSPFSCNVGDPDLVTVRNMPSRIKQDDLGEPHQFEIDATTAGSGNLEIMINGGRVNCKVREIGSRLYLATFTPVQPITHVVEMRFNGEPVKGNPWRIEVFMPSSDSTTSPSQQGFSLGGMNNVILAPINLAQLPGGGYNYLANLYSNANNPMQTGAGGATTTFSSEIERFSSEGIGQTQAQSVWAEIEGRGLQTACVGKISSFEIGASSSLRSDDIDVKILSSMSKEIPCKIIAARSGGYRCEYIAPDVGTYRIDLAIAGRTVDGSPFMVPAYAPNKVVIEPIPGGAVGQPVQFYVDANEAGKGQLEISVNQGRVPNNVQMQGPGRCLVTFIPEYTGIYVIDVTFNGDLVRGCPIRVEILEGHPTGTGYRSETNLISHGGRGSPPLGGRSSDFESPISKPHGGISGGYTSTYTTERKEYVSSSHGQTGTTVLHPSHITFPGHQAKTLRYLESPDDTQTKSYVSSFETISAPKPGDVGRITEIKRASEPSSYSTELSFKPLHPPNGSTVFDHDKPSHPRTHEMSLTKVLSRSKERILDEHDKAYAYTKRESSSDRLDLERNIDAHEIRNGGTHEFRKFESTVTPSYTTTTKVAEFSTSTPQKEKVFEKDEFPRSHYDNHTTSELVSKYETQGSIAGSERYNAKEEIEERAPIHKPETTWKTERSIDKDVTFGSSGRVDERPRYSGDKDVTFGSSGRVDERTAYLGGIDVTRGNVIDVTRGSERPKYHILTPYVTGLSDESVSFHKVIQDRSLDRTEREKFWSKEQGSAGAVTVASYGEQPRRKTSPTIRTVEYYSKTETTGADVASKQQLFTKRKDSGDNKLDKYEDKTSVGLQGARRQSEGTNKLFEFQSLKQKENSGSKLTEIETSPGRPVVSGDVMMTQRPRRSSGSSSGGSYDSEGSDKIVTHHHHKHEEKYATPVGKVVDEKMQKVADVGYAKKDLSKRGSELDLTNTKIEGPGIGVIRIKKPTYFDIKPIQCDKDLVKVVITAPSKEPVECRVRETRHGMVVEFTPTEVGTHRVHVTVGDQTHPQSPLTFRAYDPDKIHIGGIKGGFVADSIEFSVDATNAGYGNLEIAVTDKDGTIVQSKVTPQEQSSAKFVVSFIPQKPGEYYANITFNGESLKNSPFKCQVDSKKEIIDGNLKTTAIPLVAPIPMAPAKEAVTKLTQSTATAATTAETKSSDVAANREIVKKLAPIKQSVSFEIPSQGSGKPTVDVKGPNGKLIPTKIVEIDKSMYKIDFTPEVVGDHTVEVNYAGIPVQGSPFTCRVYDSQKIKVGEIQHGQVGQAVHFVVDAGEAGVGNLEVAVNEGRIPSMAHSLGQHRYDISFVPRDSLDHTISIRFNNESVPGSPFVCKMVSSNQAVASGPGLERIPVKKPTYFTVDPQGSSLQQPVVVIKDPTGQEIKPKILGTADKGFRVEYTPDIVGNHQIDIRFNNQAINDSPFIAKSYDSTKVKLFPVEGKSVGKPANFYIDAAKAGAGNMEIIVSVDNRNVPNFVQAEGNARFKVSFSPQEAKPHIVSVKFNGEPVPGSPMTCPITDGIHYSAFGDGLQQAVLNKTSSFIVDPKGSEGGDCNVVITAPSQRKSPFQIKGPDKNGLFVVEYLPVEIGPHNIFIEVDGHELDDSPFMCNVFDPEQVRLTRMGPIFVNKPAKFEIDLTKAGDGEIDVQVVNHKNQPVGCQLTPTAMGSRYEASFVPLDKQTHRMTITFNNHKIAGSPFLCEIVDSLQIEAFGDGLKLAQVDQVATFVVDLTKDGLDNDVSVKITDRAKHVLPCSVKKENGSKITVEYLPKEVGPHLIEVFFVNNPIKGSPFFCEAFDLSAVKVIGLKDCNVGKEQQFKIDYAKAGKGYIDVNVKNKNQSIRHSIHQLEDGACLCTFHPKEVGQYKVDISFNGATLPECPYEFLVRDSSNINAQGNGLNRATVNNIAHFVVNLQGAGRGEFDVVVTDPNGGAVPVKCFQQKDGNYRVEYTPNVAGDHKVDITFADHPISGSPFVCQVVDHSKVKVSELRTTLVNQDVSVLVSKKGAGKGELSAHLTDPNGKTVRTEVSPVSNLEDEIRFTPNSVGQHQLNVTFAGVDVPGSPILFSVDEPGKPGAHGEGLQKAIAREPTFFIVEAKKLKGDLKVEVLSPSQRGIKPSVNKKGDGIYEISYTPNEAGIYTVNLSWNHKPLAGSPYSVSVVDPEKIRLPNAHMDGSYRIPMKVGVPKELKIETMDAGPGKLRAEVKGPSGKVPLNTEELTDGHYRIIFTPTVEGQHDVFLFWSDVPVPHCPILCYADDTGDRPHLDGHSRESSLATEQSGLLEYDGAKVSIKGEGLRHAKTKEEAEFVIDGSEAGPGNPNCIMTGQKADVPVVVVPLGNNVWRATYTPFIAGTYNLNVLWANKPVRGSPFKVNVLSGADAGKVNVNTESLRMGIIGQDLKTTIDTRRAGPGELTAQCVGPNKVAYCELYDHRDGTYVLNIKPQETGKHNLTVKYNGDHAFGSPFTVYVSNAPDPSKVRVHGPGVEHGILSRFKSNFMVDTKGAGAGQLTVRMRGPKGAFNVEMQREKKNSRLINCKYEPKEPGDYQIEVKWAGEHVPGSPFLVMIFDTQQEIERYLAGQPVTGGPQVPFLPPGWVGPPPPGMMMPSPPPQGTMPGHPPAGFPSPRMPYPGPGFYGGSSPRRYIAQNGY